MAELSGVREGGHALSPHSGLLIFPRDEKRGVVLQKLRERGIYTLPDGQEFVVHTVFRGGYVLYTPGAWEFFGPYAYESNSTGRIRLSGRPTHWSIEDLIDTRRTAGPRSRSEIALKPSIG